MNYKNKLKSYYGQLSKEKLKNISRARTPCTDTSIARTPFTAVIWSNERDLGLHDPTRAIAHATVMHLVLYAWHQQGSDEDQTTTLLFHPL